MKFRISHVLGRHDTEVVLGIRTVRDDGFPRLAPVVMIVDGHGREYSVRLPGYRPSEGDAVRDRRGSI